MISSLGENFCFTNLLFVGIQLILPLIIYIISFFYVSLNSTNWYNEYVKDFKNQSFLVSNKFMVLSIFAFLSVGFSSWIVYDFCYRTRAGLDRSMFKGICVNLIQGDSKVNFAFYAFPIMILLSTLGFALAYNMKNFTCNVIFNFFSTFLNLYVMFYFSRRISYLVGVFLMPFLLWQILNIYLHFDKFSFKDLYGGK